MVKEIFCPKCKVPQPSSMAVFVSGETRHKLKCGHRVTVPSPTSGKESAKEVEVAPIEVVKALKLEVSDKLQLSDAFELDPALNVSIFRASLTNLEKCYCDRCLKLIAVKGNFPQKKIGVLYLLECGHSRFIEIKDATPTSVLGASEVLALEAKAKYAAQFDRSLPEVIGRRDLVKWVPTSANQSNWALVPTPKEQEVEVIRPIVVDAPDSKQHRGREIPKGRDKRWYEAAPNRPTFFQYQRDGIDFLEKAFGHHEGYRTKAYPGALVGDEMGLGKTIQAIGYARYNPDKGPFLIVCPASLVYKWQMEWKRWFNDVHKDPKWAPIILHNAFGLMEGFNVYIVSNMRIAHMAMMEPLREFGFGTVIIDESHQFKNERANRAIALQTIIDEIPRRICLSGTSILNRTSEYFPTLHMCAPEVFPNRARLEMYCMADKYGKLLGLRDKDRSIFFETTKDFVIRRRKAEVLKDLPEKRVNFTVIDITDNKQFVAGYNRLADELEEAMSQKASKASQMMTLLTILGQMRQMVAIAKVGYVLEDIKEWLANAEDGEKLAIGLHHKIIRELLMTQLLESYPLTISDEAPNIKMDRIKEFKDNPKRKLMFLSMLGAGTGLDIQFCQNVRIIERQWNRGLEQQFEDRFHRVGMKQSVDIEYILAKDTVDEFFHDLVLLKAQIMHGALDADFETDQNMMRDLAERVVAKRLKFTGM